MIVMGMDIGGSKTEAAVIRLREECFQVLGRKRIPTGRHRRYEEIIKDYCGLILSLLKEVNLSVSKLSGLGLGLPGTVDPRSQMMVMGNTSVFKNRPIISDFSSALMMDCEKIVCENDANCFALAEAQFGAGKFYEKEFGVEFSNQIAIGIILGTGCGGGVIINGRPLKGASGGAAEFGHNELYTNGHACYCGRRGCAETYLSGPSLEAHFASRIYSQISDRPNAQKIFELALNQDPVAMAVVQSYQQDLAKFLADLTNTFSPHYFVLGGGVSREQSLYHYFEKEIPYIKFINNYSPKVLMHKLGDSAGVIGAALLIHGQRH